MRRRRLLSCFRMRGMMEPRALVQQRHRALYKGSSRAQLWKETFRQRCAERLKKNRARLLDRFRQAGLRDVHQGQEALLVQEVMEIEWKALQDTDVQLPPLWGPGAIPQMLEEAMDLRDLEEIQQELLLQEQLAMEEYERTWQFDEECLNATLEGLDAGYGIICPVCRRNDLRVTNHLVECPCGLNISTQGMSEEKLRLLLEDSMTEHNHHCPCLPEFTLIEGIEGEKQLLLSCQVCDSLAVVL